MRSQVSPGLPPSSPWRSPRWCTAGRGTAGDFPRSPHPHDLRLCPGGSGDLAARLLADVASRVLGQRVVVENRTGANGMIAAEAIARSSNRRVQRAVLHDRQHDHHHRAAGRKLSGRSGDRARRGWASSLRSTFGLVVRQQSPWRTTQDVIDAARAKPGTFHLRERRRRFRPASVGRAARQKTAPRWCTCLSRLAGGNARHHQRPDRLHDHQPRRRDPHIRQGTLRLIALGDPLGRQFFPDAPMIADTVPGLRDLCLVRPVRSA